MKGMGQNKEGRWYEMEKKEDEGLRNEKKKDVLEG